MLNWFRRRAEAARTAGELYGRVVAAARQPYFYKELGVADTPEGRFELVALHLFLVLEALRSRSDCRDVSRLTTEAFVSDMDDCMREMGVGDLTVPKKVRRAAAAFYERAANYRPGLEVSGNEKLTEALSHAVYKGDDERHRQASVLARYARSLSNNLSNVEPGLMLASPDRLAKLLRMSTP
jgi:cytochrome b pre-mRNA-processing protein 3